MLVAVASTVHYTMYDRPYLNDRSPPSVRVPPRLVGCPDRIYPAVGNQQVPVPFLVPLCTTQFRLSIRHTKPISSESTEGTDIRQHFHMAWRQSYSNRCGFSPTPSKYIDHHKEHVRYWSLDAPLRDSCRRPHRVAVGRDCRIRTPTPSMEAGEAHPGRCKLSRRWVACPGPPH